MPRLKKFPTRMVRVRLDDVEKLKKLAKRAKKSLPDYINSLTRKI